VHEYGVECIVNLMMTTIYSRSSIPNSFNRSNICPILYMYITSA